VGESQQRRGDVLVGELVVGAAGRLGQPALGGEHAPEWFWLACLWPFASRVCRESLAAIVLRDSVRGGPSPSGP